jgi:dienelactone hydrolase
MTLASGAACGHRPEVSLRAQSFSLRISHPAGRASGWRCVGQLIKHWLLPVAMLAMSALAIAGDTSSEPTGLQRDVIFTDYSPLAASTELMQRTMSPLRAERVRVELARSRKQMREQAIELVQERFAVYVPKKPPDSGYALLVFVPSWQNAILPQRWAPELDRNGMIYVSAANSGNAESILDRREPLALLAAHNIMRRYPINPQRVYIGGFSGGSRVALRIALGYPDVFHGALLIAGSDPIGDAQAPLPATELFRQFQTSTRLVYLTGNDDPLNVEQDAASRHSLREWCVFGLDSEIMSRAGHELPDPSSLHRALIALTNPLQIDPLKLAACRARVEEGLGLQLQKLTQSVASDNLRDAWHLLDNIDSRYGGLALPRSVDFARQINAHR